MRYTLHFIIIFFLVSIASAQSTNGKRNILLEQHTGTWCGYCPVAEWYADSIAHSNPNNIVVLGWHGPTYKSEPYKLDASDSLSAHFGISAYPLGVMDRNYTGAFNEDANKKPKFSQSTRFTSTLQSKPLLDVAITNVAVMANSVAFDLEVSPLDKSKLPTEDTTNYTYVIVLTEDNLVHQQTNYGNGGLPDEPIPNFVHRNVVRAAAGKVFGESIVIGTGDAGMIYPIRKHVEMNISSSWLRENLRIKAFVQMSAMATPTKYQTLNAIQSPYLSTLDVRQSSASSLGVGNYPNPFSSLTTIHFEVSERSFTSIVIRDLLGNEVARLVNQTLDTGKYSTEFSADNLPNGIYTYTLESGSNKVVGKMSIMK